MARSNVCSGPQAELAPAGCAAPSHSSSSLGACLGDLGTGAPGRTSLMGCSSACGGTGCDGRSVPLGRCSQNHRRCLSRGTPSSAASCCRKSDSSVSFFTRNDLTCRSLPPGLHSGAVLSPQC